MKFKIQYETVLLIMESLIKCLFEWFDSTLKDMNNDESLQQHKTKGMKKIENTRRKIKVLNLPTWVCTKATVVIDVI